MSLTQDRVRELLDYDPSTGEFRWKWAEPRSRGEAIRNGRMAGKIAGTTHVHTGGIAIKIDGEFHLAHRLAFLWMTGETPPCVIHLNGAPKDNRWENLRAVTNSQLRASGKGWARRSGPYRGVRQMGNRFGATVYQDGRQHWLGCHDTAEQAARAHDAKARELYGEFASLNFPDQ